MMSMPRFKSLTFGGTLHLLLTFSPRSRLTPYADEMEARGSSILHRRPSPVRTLTPHLIEEGILRILVGRLIHQAPCRKVSNHGVVRSAPDVHPLTLPPLFLCACFPFIGPASCCSTHNRCAFSDKVRAILIGCWICKPSLLSSYIGKVFGNTPSAQLLLTSSLSISRQYHSPAF